MKKYIALLGFAVLGFNSTSQAATQQEMVRLVTSPEFQAAISAVTPLDLINWKVGDTQHYDVSLGFLGKGTMVKSVTKDEGTAIWVHQDMDLSVQKDVSDILINKADAKILKYIHNGKEEAITDDKLEVISQEYGEITVPAGTFKC